MTSISSSSVKSVTSPIVETTTENVFRFRTAFDKSKRFAVPSGNGVDDTYEKQIDKFGAVSFVKTGSRNLYEEIQAHAEETDINFIVSRCVKNGTLDLLADNGKGSVDVSMLPDNFLDLWNLKERLNNEFLKLPPEERELFKNSPILYIDSRFAGSAEKIISDFRAQKNEAVNDGEGVLKNE